MRKIIDTLNESRVDVPTIIRFKAGSRLYNARGTSRDRVVVLEYRNNIEMKEMIHAWEALTHEDLPRKCPNRCCASQNNSETRIVGAHVLRTYAEHDIKTGEEVYIIPLCNSCNSSGVDMKIVLDIDISGLKLIWNKNDVKRKNSSIVQNSV